MKHLLHVFSLACLPGVAAAQTAHRPPVLTEEQEIALARSAAPDRVSRDATIFVLDDAHYRTAVEGSNGVACLVSRSLPLSLEPICYDPEAARTILPQETMRVELRLAGVTPEEIDRRIEALHATGELALPERPAMAYMMSAGQVLYADAETRVGRWMPHLHLFIPYATAEQFGGFSNEMVPSVGSILDEGEPNASIVIKVREFIEPTEPAPGDDVTNQAQHDRRIDYVEFSTTDIEETKRFYSEVFGWEFTDYGPSYTSFTDGRLSGGFALGSEASSGGPLVVLYATDLEALETQVRASGGRITKPIFEFPGGRRFHFVDPVGNELAVWGN